MVFEDTLQPGQLILTSFGNYEHMSIVSDCRCNDGKPMLISATARTGTVKEEPYDTVVNGRKTGLAPQQPTLPLHQVLLNARSKIGKWRYGFATRNCEVFACWAAGLKITSRQINGTLCGAAFALTTVKIVSEKPNLPLLALAGIFGGVIGLASTQVLR